MLRPPEAPDTRSSPATKAALQSLCLDWQRRAHPIGLRDAGLRVFSQFEEDGILLAIFAAIGTTNRTFVDIGSGDGINSNCANLAVNFGWHGLFIDGDAGNITRGRAWYAGHPDTWLYPPTFMQSFVTRENINDTIQSAGFGGPIDLLSLDIDGNDYWIWDTLTAVQPRVVIVEANDALGNDPVTVPYDPNFSHAGDEYFGASASAFCHLAREKGYRLVGANRFGFNLIFVRRNDGEAALPEVTLASVRTHARAQREFSAHVRPLVRVDQAPILPMVSSRI